MASNISQLIHPYIYEDIKTISDNQVIDWSRFKNKTILLTGAGGFIGYYLTCAVLIRNDVYGDNIKIIALERDMDFMKKRFGDILNRDDIIVVIQDVCDDLKCERADFVIHAASQASAYFFENDPVGTINANLSGTAKVLDYAKASNAECTLFISSLKIYGTLRNGKNHIDEDDIGYVDQTDYKNCYAIGKRASETLCACYHKQYNMSIKIARPSYIYGPSRIDDDRVWAQFIANIVKSQDILLKSNGAALRSFCYVTDTASAILKILLDGENVTPYNIANPKSDVTIRNFAKAAVEVFPEKNMKLVFANPEDEKEPEVSKMAPTPEILNGDKLNSIGWQAQVDLKSGIKRAVKIVELQNK